MDDRMNWDQKYEKFLAERGYPRFSYEVDSRELALKFLSKELAEEFAKQYPETE